MTTLTDTTVRWRGTTFYSDPREADWVDSLDGWEEWDSRRHVFERPMSAGSMGGAPLGRDRVVRVTGMCRNPADRDAKLAEYGELFARADPEDAVEEDLTITVAGRTLTARVYLTRYRPSLDLWGAGYFRWAVEFQADDPVRYGPPVTDQATFPVLVGGLRYPLYTDGEGTDLGWLDYGPAPTSGRLTLVNPGIAAATVQHEVTGPVPAEGFEIVAVATGRRLVYEGAVAAGSRVLLDGATGQALVDGLYDRGDLLTRREWTKVPGKGGSAEFALVNRGTATAAVLRSTLRPPY